MKKSSLIGIASALVKSRKLKLIFVGAQFAYLGYQLVRKRKQKKLDE
ncbi:hypothetical protein HME9304_01462 [Flagellimonas maritima]|uniref:Uncharacterized protein n=1 Tax=Flagellimonas maritima TaxID=1383885 RepID=A0A2Z4LRD0_9FLAO|nr:hypothetical protein [Allomuricauda aurantiaca]AWX44461.1 hypothetical protein HME9304_01462 [Allomuricauda aurantiaca]